MPEGWKGWDEYARFYDWENAQTVGRQDVPFWKRLAATATGRVLELGCGTGRVTIPLARAGVDIVGVDRSPSMLARARRKTRKRLALVRADIRSLPFGRRAFAMVLAPYGVLQSLTGRRDLSRTLASIAAIVEPGGVLAVDLVPDVPRWREYSDRVTFRGRSGGANISLVESVRQDRPRGLTTFDERYVEQRGRRTIERRFSLVFRTLTVDGMRRALARAGFTVETVLGDYQGFPWDERADVWIVLARRKRAV